MTNVLSLILVPAASSRDQAGGALCSANVPRPRTALAVHGLLPQSERIRYSGCVSSSLMSLRRARHRPDLATLVGSPTLHIHPARCLGAWGEWRSVDLGFCQIKEEPEGRGTFAEPFTPSAEAYKTTNCIPRDRPKTHQGVN